MTDLERAAVFGAEALAKLDAGEPTTKAEDTVVLRMIGRKINQSVAAERAAKRELIPA